MDRVFCGIVSMGEGAWVGDGDGVVPGHILGFAGG